MKIHIVNGPNLNRLGTREPSIYGSQTMEQCLDALRQKYAGTVELEYYQSNVEGFLIDALQAADDAGCDGIVLNAGGYTHTSVALRDAVACCCLPVVEVHISDITQREAFRRVSLLTDVCAHTIIGHGTDGYIEAIDFLLNKTSCPRA